MRLRRQALTNGRKPEAAPAAEAATRSTVIVRVDPDDVLVLATDDGAVRGRPLVRDEGAGNGLRGMRERAEMYAGMLVSAAGPEGWTVTCRLSRQLSAAP